MANPETPNATQQATNENPFSINSFLGHLNAQKEFAYASKFNCMITVPSFLESLNYGRELILSCENAELPGVEVSQIELRHYSFTQRVPAKLSFAPITVLFYCTGKMMEKRFFDTWADNTIPFNTGLVEYPLDAGVYSTVTINQFDLQGNISYAVKLIDAYPISVSPLILNWADDSVNKLQVVFAYKKWLTVDTQKMEISDGQSSQTIEQTLINNMNNTSKPNAGAPDVPTTRTSTRGGGF